MLRAEHLDDRVRERAVRASLHVERVADRRRNRFGITHGRELDEPEPVGEPYAERGREAVREACLPDAARPEQGEDATRLEQARRQCEVAFVADERRALGGNGAPARRRCRGGVASTGGRRLPGKRGILFEDRGLEIANHRRRFEAELFAAVGSGTRSRLCSASACRPER